MGSEQTFLVAANLPFSVMMRFACMKLFVVDLEVSVGPSTSSTLIRNKSLSSMLVVLTMMLQLVTFMT